MGFANYTDTRHLQEQRHQRNQHSGAEGFAFGAYLHANRHTNTGTDYTTPAIQTLKSSEFSEICRLSHFTAAAGLALNTPTNFKTTQRDPLAFFPICPQIKHDGTTTLHLAGLFLLLLCRRNAVTTWRVDSHENLRTSRGVHPLEPLRGRATVFASYLVASALVSFADGRRPCPLVFVLSRCLFGCVP